MDSRNPGRKQDHRVKNQLLHRKTGKKDKKKTGDFPKFRESRKKTGPPSEKSTFTSENRKKDN